VHCRLMAALFAVMVGIAGCGDQSAPDAAVPATQPPQSDPTVIGFVTDVTPFEPITENCIEADPEADPDAPVSSDGLPVCSDPDTVPLGTVLVEEDPAAASGDDKVSFTVDAGTALLIESSSSHGPASFDDLAVGTAVTAWADGPIMESYPAQARAGAIVIRSS
jgi:Protein of unknown function (DUF3221)